MLVVEDTEKLAQALEDSLRRIGYDVTVASSGTEGLEAALVGPFDAIVLDVMLPGMDGLTVLKSLRARGLATPVLLLTARDEIDDRVKGLDAGADDYLVKPFALPELQARLRALSRRGRPDPRLSIADLAVDRLARRATRADQELILTPKEFDLLVYLIQHAGEIVPREMIARDVWQQRERSIHFDNVIDVHLVRLRKKVDDGFTPRLIHTIRGLGVMLSVRLE